MNVKHCIWGGDSLRFGGGRNKLIIELLIDRTIFELDAQMARQKPQIIIIIIYYCYDHPFEIIIIICRVLNGTRGFICIYLFTSHTNPRASQYIYVHVQEKITQYVYGRRLQGLNNGRTA